MGCQRELGWSGTAHRYGLPIFWIRKEPQPCNFVNTLKKNHFKRMDFTVGELYLKFFERPRNKEK